jgi:hypothetical protein
MLSCALSLPLSSLGLFHRDFSQTNPLDGRPDDGVATHLGRKHVNLIGSLPDIAKQTLNGVCGSGNGKPLHKNRALPHFPCSEHSLAKLFRRELTIKASEEKSVDPYCTV